MTGLLPPCMSRVDSSRSSAVSAAVTTTGESASPQGVTFHDGWANQLAQSVRPALSTSSPAAS
jgi:hypothetical protein